MPNIILDDDNRTITAGHCVIKGADSYVGLNSPKTGTWTVSLNGEESRLLLAHPDTRKYTVSVNGKECAITLNDSNGHQAVSMDGDKKQVTVGHCVIKGADSYVGLNSPQTGTWTVSLNGEEGRLLLAHPDTRKYTVGLNAKESKISVNDSNGHPAILLDGNAGDIILQNADCAEAFDVHIQDMETTTPGTVMVIDSEGMMRPCAKAYDRCVAGITSGAGDLKPGLILGKDPEKPDRLPIALIGKVYCKVDAEFGAIEMGDMLTSSDTPGHAMKASDPARAFGAVIGKALRPLESGQGLIPVLVALQ